MGRYPLMSAELRRTHRPGDADPVGSLPVFYMADYTVLGLLVDRCGAAERILSESGFPVFRSAEGVTVGIETPEQMRRALETLDRKGVACELADVAETIYQG